MKLHEVLSIIGGGTKIIIYVGCITIFSGKMAERKMEGGCRNILRLRSD